MNLLQKVSLIEPEGGFLEEQLAIEGISLHRLKDFIELGFRDRKRVVIANNRQVSKNTAEFLRKWIALGNTLVAVNPDDEIAECFGLGKWIAQEEVFLRIGNETVQAFNAKRFQLPKNAHALAKCMEGSAYVSEQTIGKGKLVVFAFDLNQTLYRLTHGNEIREDIDGDGILRVDDGIAVKGALKESPQADLLKRFLIAQIEDEADFPLPRIWFFPNAKKAGIIFTHDSDAANNESIRAVNEVDKGNGIRATIFIRPNEFRYMKEFRETGQGLGLHPFLKVGKVLALQELAFRLGKWLSGFRFSAKGSRNHGLQWGSLEKFPLWIEKAGMKFDSTYGSNYNYGYLQGTGQPYFLHSQKTMERYDVLEFPCQLMEAAFIKHDRLDDINHSDYTKERFDAYKQYTRNFLDKALDDYHSLITASFHYKYLTEGQDKVMDWYRDMQEYAQEKGFLIESMGWFNEFCRKRMKCRIMGISWEKEEMNVDIEKGKSAESIEGLTLALPKKHNNFYITKKGQGCAKILDKDYVLFEIGKESSLKVKYR